MVILEFNDSFQGNFLPEQPWTIVSERRKNKPFTRITLSIVLQIKFP